MARPANGRRLLIDAVTTRVLSVGRLSTGIALAALISMGTPLAVAQGGSSSLPDTEPPVAMKDVAPLPPPDDSPIFQAVRDRVPMQFDENAAYAELVQRVRETSPEELESICRRDVLFSDLLARPERYRGLPIRLQGTARRVLMLPDVPKSMSQGGQLYEAWVFTSDSQGFPYDLVFEEPPAGLPSGDNVQAFVVFHGYFLKLLAYRAADKPRVAPLLIGRIEYVPDIEAPVASGPLQMAPMWLWTAVPLAIVALFAAFRVASILHRSRGAGLGVRRLGRTHREEISAEELQHWLKEAPSEPEAESDEADPDEPPRP